MSEVDLPKAQLEAAPEEYVKCGFSLTANQDGSVDVTEIDAASDGLAISCSLNIGIWSPKGNFTVDPDEDGIVCHIPVQGQPFAKPTNTEYREFINHGKWFVDILYGLNPANLAVAKCRLEDTFQLSNQRNDVLLIERKFRHKMYRYKWPYVIRVYPHGLASVTLRRPLPLRLIPWIKRRLD